MKRKSLATLTSIALTATLAAAYCAETYLASGWQNFRWNTKSDQSTQDAPEQNKGGNDLKSLINTHLGCEADADQQKSKNNESPNLSIWLSPYRRFPEEAAEGDNRGIGDYEYFSYLADSKCGRIASNYGTFKMSPADKTFTNASEQGLRSELLLAQKLGYDVFALDTRKIWLTMGDRNLCMQDRGACTETGDGFMVINLKTKASPIKNPDFLVNSVRIGPGIALEQSIDMHSITAARASQWYGWESPKPGAAFRWSNGAENQSRSIELLTPAFGRESPANLTTIIVANPSVSSLMVGLVCTQGRNQVVKLTVQGNRDISETVKACLPKGIRVVRALAHNNLIISGQAPRLSEEDSRQSFLGIMYQAN